MELLSDPSSMNGREASSRHFRKERISSPSASSMFVFGLFVVFGERCLLFLLLATNGGERTLKVVLRVVVRVRVLGLVQD